MRLMPVFSLTAIFFGLLFAWSACRVDPPQTQTAYPVEIERIMLTRCAQSGCHNNQSAVNAANLNLSSFTDLLKGGNSGAVVVPFSPEQSTLFQFINTYNDLGPIAKPTMPINLPPLSREEVLLIKNWILKGCPNRNGEIPFSSNAATRPKAYISNQGCDGVSIVDAETRLVMRYVKIGGNLTQIENPHCLRVSPNKQSWYVCYSSGQYFDAFDAVADTLRQRTFLGNGNWNILKVTPDSRYVSVTDFSNNGKWIEMDAQTLAIRRSISGNGILTFPHGIAYSKTQDTVYVTAQYGNMIYRLIPAIPQIDAISLQPGQAPVTTPQLLDPHEVLMSPNYQYYFITCQASNEVRVMRTGYDTLVAVIPTGTYPLEMALSAKRNELYVVCQEDNNPNYPGFKGSVYVIDMQTYAVKRKIYERFYQPHGIAVDDTRGELYVASRNADPNGPAPHHVSACDGRNGFFHVLDLTSYQVLRASSELSVDPYSLDVKE
ncbi:MAG: c-type cytochrome domain-containing protein [Chitinophagaceae bacterium]